MDNSNNASSGDVEQSYNWIPRIGMEFNSIDEAWNFWEEYGAKMGFNVRKHYSNKNVNGEISSRRFLCAKEGRRRPNNKGVVLRRRSETRTGCKVRMGCCLMKSTGKYKVHDFVSDHNHLLHTPKTSHFLLSQRSISDVQAIEIDLADDSGIKPKAAHEFLGAHVGGSENLGYTHRDHKNYLRTKRQRNLQYGEAGSLLNYFHLQTVENPSFQYSIQLDCEEKITNIFWADAKMQIDYASFGDVVAFDTTFGTNKENRPLGVFVGFNQFREMVIFGAALLYDETTDSFKWLFETFLATHDHKNPKTIFTDQDIAMGKAVAEVMPNTFHGLCTWHIMENATKHLMRNASNALQDFKACIYDHDEVDTFEEAFSALRGKVEKSTWLNSIYSVKTKWAECYMKDVLSLGIRSTQLSESFNSDLKDYLQCNLDIMRFFQHFDRVVKQKRRNESYSEYEARERLPRIKMQRTPLLRQVGELYTPKVFEAFQDEYDWSTAAYIKPPLDNQPSNEHRVAISDFENQNVANIEYKVFGDPSSQTVTCSCKMFERLGILCAHALKVLDTMNIKLLPQKYILKRWTREGRSEMVHDINGRVIVEDPKLDATLRFRAHCRKFIKVASRAANYEEVSNVLDHGMNNVIIEVEKKLSSLKIDPGETSSLSLTQATESVFKPKQLTLKKKEGGKGSKRKKNWNEKLHKQKKKTQPNQNSNPNQTKSNATKDNNQSKGYQVLQHGRSSQLIVGQTSLVENPTIANNSFTQMLLGQWNGSPGYSDSYLWSGSHFQSHLDMSFDRSQQYQTSLRDIPNVWAGNNYQTHQGMSFDPSQHQNSQTNQGDISNAHHLGH